MELTGLTALVTGGASGIGAAVVSNLAARGARVAVLDMDATQKGDAELTVQCDVGDDNSVRAAVERVAGTLGGIDIVINNAGIGAQGTVESNEDEEWHRVFDVNVLGMVRVSRAALEHLRRSENAVIVNTCSVVAVTGIPTRALYSATKGAVLAMSLSMASDHLREGIRVNCVSPGTADTPWISRLMSQAEDPDAERRALEARQPTGRLVTADEVAWAVGYLVSPQARSTTGVNLQVDGGLVTLRPRPAE